MIFTMAANPRISIIFVNYQSVWPLSLALRSLFLVEQELDLFEVIVVNNDNREQRALEQLAHYLPFRLVSSGTNIGFGQGANIGASLARGKIIGFLNPDTEWLEKRLKEVEGFMEKQPVPSILGFRLVDREGKQEPWSSGKTPNFAQLFFNNLPLLGFLRNFSENETLDWVSGGGLFIFREDFLGLGGFDKDFFLYFEDVDLCLRAKQRGMAVKCHHRFSLLHSGGKSFSSQSRQKRDFYASQSLYFHKHRPAFESVLVRLLHSFFHGL